MMIGVFSVSVFAPQPPAKLHSAHSRKHQIENYQRRRAFFVEREPQTFFARFGNQRAKTLALEVVMQTLGDVRIVFDD